MPLINQTFSQIITFTRASGATYFDAAGTLQTAATDIPRFDYNPSTLAAQGLLIEEQRTNSIRNNTMVGAVVGTPGTLPTNWQITTASGLTTNVIGIGTENGISYVDLQAVGTASGTSYVISAELGGTIAANSTQSWASSAFIKTVAGSTANISSFSVGWAEQNSVPSFLGFTSGTVTVSGTGSLAESRKSFGVAVVNATTAFVRPALILAVANGAAIDITLRIGLPQLELGAFATSVIPTTTTALTRSADVASVNTLSPWFNVTEGSFYTEWIVSALGIDNNIASLSDGTTNNRHQNYVSITNSVVVRTAAAGVASSNANGTAVANAVGKWAFGYGSGATASSFNGNAVVTTTQAIPSSINILYLGLSSAGAGQKQIWLRRYTYYPRKLSNAELQAITA